MYIENTKKEMLSQEILTVSRYLDTVNAGLKSAKAKILGEVSGIQEYPGRSYLYYSVKDTKDGSTIKCFMWKNDYKISGVTLREGIEVILTAYPAIYKPNGGLSLQVEGIELVGEGALQIAYEQLKKKLTDEGLFSESRKREIPQFPNKIGVITSKSGAVINDFLSNIGKFGFQIKFVDSKVEGDGAIKDLLSAINTLKKEDLDALVIMRGGGSLESFQAFNNESLVRAVADFPVPVITGIGHDKDAPLVSMVSDVNVSTPTAVASLLNEGWQIALSDVLFAEEKVLNSFSGLLRDTQYLLETGHNRIQDRFGSIFETFRRSEEALLLSFSRVGFSLSDSQKNLNKIAKDLEKNFSSMVFHTKEKIHQIEKNIENFSPNRQLKRGYSIVKKGKKIVRSKKDVKEGESLEIAVLDGIIKSVVKSS